MDKPPFPLFLETMQDLKVRISRMEQVIAENEDEVSEDKIYRAFSDFLDHALAPAQSATHSVFSWAAKRLMHQHPLRIAYPGGNLEVIRDGVIRITVPERTERLETFCDMKGNLKSNAYRAAWERWVGYVIGAVRIAKEERRLPDGLPWKKTLVVVHFYVPTNVRWDPDNRTINIILDTVVSSRLAVDDSWDKMVHMVQGFYDPENPRTEIYVIRDGLAVGEAFLCSLTAAVEP
ncbi:hypothetical protein GTO91_15845 [Heliobacterium undosum]|uniref:Uncharacterized protein n=1 Tax=Heliomicrobium undosum TaxID=121734 RepID=A0A845L979_9FIRM|nr:hypothetical protein [Heliomicrobium undosum]MZP31180.1 hypothetical protein [Heliomicrobium undosum]